MRRLTTRPAAWRTALPALAVAAACIFIPPAPAQDDPIKMAEAKRIELKKREERVQAEEVRLAVLRKDVDTRIADYTKLLARIESSLKQFEQGKNAQLDNLVKAYEAMPAEDAAVRISVLDNATAVMIMQRMKSKKAGLVMAAMDPGRAAVLTRNLSAARIEKEK